MTIIYILSRQVLLISYTTHTARAQRIPGYILQRFVVVGSSDPPL